MHRSGRTARAFKSGLSVLLIDPSDMQFYKRICKNLHRSILKLSSNFKILLYLENDLTILEIDSLKLMQACQYRIKMAVNLEASEFGLKKVYFKFFNTYIF